MHALVHIDTHVFTIGSLYQRVHCFIAVPNAQIVRCDGDVMGQFVYCKFMRIHACVW